MTSNTAHGRIVERLVAAPSLRGVPLEAVGELAGHCKLMKFKPGKYLIKEGNNDDVAYLICSGEVVILARKFEVVVRRKGELVGEFSALDGRPRSSSVVTRTDVETVRIPGPEWQQFLAERRRAGLNLAMGLVGKLRQTVVQYAQMSVVLDGLEPMEVRSPYPLACTWMDMDAATTGAELRGPFVSFVEALVAYVGTIAATLLDGSGKTLPPSISSGKPASGNWLEVIRAGLTSEVMQGEDREWLLPLVEEPNFIRYKNKAGAECQGKLLRLMDKLVTLRNPLVHGRTLPGQVYLGAITPYLSEVQEVMSALDFLEDWCPYVVLAIKGSSPKGFCHQVRRLKGTSITSRALEAHLQKAVDPQSVLLLSSDLSFHLDLSNWIRFDVCATCERETLFIFNGWDRRRDPKYKPMDCRH
jgi:CRP-like cAMP-binding protein